MLFGMRLRSWSGRMRRHSEAERREGSKPKSGYSFAWSHVGPYKDLSSRALAHHCDTVLGLTGHKETVHVGRYIQIGFLPENLLQLPSVLWVPPSQLTAHSSQQAPPSLDCACAVKPSDLRLWWSVTGFEMAASIFL